MKGQELYRATGHPLAGQENHYWGDAGVGAQKETENILPENISLPPESTGLNMDRALCDYHQSQSAK